MDKEEIERECRELIGRYCEEQKRFEEVLFQFVSCSSIEHGKPIEFPKRVFDPAEIEKAKQKLDEVYQEMDEACNRLYEAYH